MVAAVADSYAGIRFVSLREVADRLGVSLTHAKQLRATDPRFPRPHRAGLRLVRFREDQVAAYMASLEVGGREAATA